MMAPLLFLLLQNFAAALFSPGPNPIIDGGDVMPLLADPTIIEHNRTLYVYPTGDEHSYNVFTLDLTLEGADWERHPTPVFTSTMSFCAAALIPGAGNNQLVWAPHVYHDKNDGLFYLYYTECLRIGVAVSYSPLGPFIDRGVLKYKAIDAFVMRSEDDGELYFMYGSIFDPLPFLFEGIAESIMGQRMLSPTELDTSESAVQIVKPNQEWDFGHDTTDPLGGLVTGVNEGPWLHKAGGLWHLTYSGGAANSEFYRLGVATATHPLGPYTKAESNPFIRPVDPATIGVFGPGHHSLWTDADTGKQWAFYHAKKHRGVGWERYVCVDELLTDEETGELTLVVTLGER